MSVSDELWKGVEELGRRLGQEAIAKMANEPGPPRSVLETVEREKAAVAAGDWAAYLTVLAEDAIFMPPNSPAKSGDALRTWLSAFVRDFQVEWLGFVSAEVHAVEDLAYHTFSYEWRVTKRSGGEGQVGGGKGLHILRRQQDGSWRISREIWNATPR